MTRTLKSVTLVSAFSLVAAAGAPLLGQQPAKTAAPAKPAAAAKTAIDGGWPRAYATASGASVVLYQPQVAGWPDQKHISGYAAVAYTAKGAAKPALGTIKIEADTSVALAERLVNFSDLTIDEANFPTLPKDQLKAVVVEITQAVPRDDRVIALDRVLASI